MLVFAVPILTHLAAFERYDDLEMLKKLQSALWFIMEPLITKNENFSFGFYKALLEKMKTQKDKRKGDDEATNLVSGPTLTKAQGATVVSSFSETLGPLRLGHEHPDQQDD
jgi:hypothetical protein